MHYFVLKVGILVFPVHVQTFLEQKLWGFREWTI